MYCEFETVLKEAASRQCTSRATNGYKHPRIADTLFDHATREYLIESPYLNKDRRDVLSSSSNNELLDSSRDVHETAESEEQEVVRCGVK